MTIATHLIAFAAGVAAAFYAPKLWAIAKQWIVAKLGGKTE